MASNADFHYFALHIFSAFWEELNIPFSSVENKKYLEVSNALGDDSEIFDPNFNIAIITGGVFYAIVHERDIKIKNINSQKDLCNYMREMCGSKEWFGTPTVFERLFSTVNFVVDCVRKDQSMTRHIQRYANLCWEKYFKEYSLEFYNAGGWQELSRISCSYLGVMDFIYIAGAIITYDFHIKLSESIENYLYFISNRNVNVVSKLFKTLKIENKNQYKSCTILWIKFIVENGNAKRFFSVCTQAPKNPSEVTCLIRVMRRLCDPSDWESRKFCSTLKPYLPHKTYEQVIVTSEKNPEAFKNKKKLLESANKFNSIKGKEDLNSKFTGNKGSFSETAIEKKFKVKDCDIKNCTTYKTDGNKPHNSPIVEEMLKKSNKKKKKSKKK